MLGTKNGKATGGEYDNNRWTEGNAGCRPRAGHLTVWQRRNDGTGIVVGAGTSDAHRGGIGAMDGRAIDASVCEVIDQGETTFNSTYYLQWEGRVLLP